MKTRGIIKNIAILVLLAFTGCERATNEIRGKIGFDSVVTNTNGVTCVPNFGKLGVYRDPNNNGQIEMGESLLGEISSYQTPVGLPPLTAAANYNYNYDILLGIDNNGSSGLPTYGPPLVDQRNTLFFYNASDGLMLYFISSINNGGSGSSGMNLKVTQNNRAELIKVTDDLPGAEDFFTDNSLPSDRDSSYSFKLVYGGNTDGYVLGPFASNVFQVKATMSNVESSQDVDFASSDGSKFSLNTPLTMGTPSQLFSFVMAWTVPPVTCP